MKGTVLYTDKSIIKGLKEKNIQTIKYLYRSWYPSIESFVLRNNGEKMDAEDVFQDALVIFYKKVVYEDLVLTCAAKTYMYSVSKNLWFQRLQKKEKRASAVLKTEYTEPFESNTSETEQNKYDLYKKHFLKLSEDCQKILTLFLKKISLKEISKRMKHSSPDYTKTRKYLCKKELIKRILNDPEYKNIK